MFITVLTFLHTTYDLQAKHVITINEQPSLLRLHWKRNVRVVYWFFCRFIEVFRRNGISSDLPRFSSYPSSVVYERMYHLFFEIEYSAMQTSRADRNPNLTKIYRLFCERFFFRSIVTFTSCSNSLKSGYVIKHT